MPQFIAGPGQGLPIPQNLYPSELVGMPPDFATNEVTLSPGDTLPIAAGQWWISSGSRTVLQFLDPITGIWRGFGAVPGGARMVRSDGFNIRLANLTGCVASAVVTNGGTGYVASTATCTASAGSSTYQCVVGGILSVVSVGSAGSSYTIAPLVFIPAPPAPGVAATAAATISAGTVASVSLTNVGAGYQTTPPTAVLLPSPNDPNFGTISQATVVLGVVGSGQVSAVLVTNAGAPQAGAVAPTLTFGGTSGTAASASAVMMSTATALSIIAAGGGYPTTNNVEITSIGGQPTAGVNINPAVELTGYLPRPAVIRPTITGGTIAATGTIFDGGLFMAAPNALLIQNGGGTTGSVQLVLGSVNDTSILQPL